MTRKDSINELDKELYMRRKVWRKNSEKPLVFSKSEHQKRYRTMENLQQRLKMMTDSEFYELGKRLEREQQAKAAQTTMF